VKLATPLKLDATRQTLTLTSSDEGLCVDKLILTNDPKYAPKTLDDRFATPSWKVCDLIVKEATNSSVRIAWWDPVASPDVAYYSVFVGDRADFPCDQAHIIASTAKNELLDWGLAAGKDHVYKIVAVNRRGLASEPRSITAKTQPLEKVVLIEMAAQEAKLDPRLKVEEKDGKKYVYLPDQGEAHQKDDPAAVTFDFETPVAGEYMMWCEYAPGDTSTSTMSLPTLLDNFLDGKGVWKIRPPFRVMAGSNYRVWKKDLWFTDKVSIYTWPKAHDLLKLSAGKHQLTIKLPCQAAEFPHKIARVWITNDQWFRPPGWDAQADIRKARTKRE
jgi:hypothetical protein